MLGEQKDEALKYFTFLLLVNIFTTRILLLAAFTLVVGNVHAQDTELASKTLLLDKFERLYIADQINPPATDTGWQAVILKDIWTIAVRKQHKEAWYRTDVHLDAAPDQPWSVFVPRVSALASFWVNGVEVGRSSKINNKLPNAWNRPVLVTFPSSVLHAGNNNLEIRLKVSDAVMGVLYEVYLGPESELAPTHAKAYFAKVTASQILTLIMVLVSAMTLFIYFKGSQPKSYFWFFLGSLCWAIYSVGLYIENIPLAEWLWQGISRLSLMASVIFYSFSVHRMLNIKRSKYEIFLWSLLGLVIVTMLTSPEIEISRLDNYAWLICIILVSVLGLTLCWWGWKGRKRQQLWLGIAGCAILFLAWYDMYMAANQITALFAKFPYIPVVAVVAGGAAFFSRFLRTDQEFTQLKTEFVQQKQRAASEAVVEERSRMMREIHDGVGGQLVSALSMLENKDVRNSQVVRSLRTSLDDLRTVINSLETMGQEGNIVTILATMRERIELQLKPHDITLDWDINPLPALENFGSEQSLQVMRIVQEAITNVLKHSRADTVRVTSGECQYNEFNPSAKKRRDAGILIAITNNGLTEVLKTQSSGVGLSNMSHRASVLGGEFMFSNDDALNRSGEAIAKLWIPVKSQRLNSNNDELPINTDE